MDKIEKFCTKIGYEFSNDKLLEEALTHPSLSKGKKVKFNYQRLEFFGDKVLGLIITEFLFEKYQNDQEGALSKRQAAIVSGETLSEIALEIGLDKVIKISLGEEKMGGRTNKRNLENSLEALVGAIYLDSNYESAKTFVLKFWQKALAENAVPQKDPISQLQEIVQSKMKKLPSYQTTQDGGVDHEPEFVSIVSIPGIEKTFQAKGKSKKEAQKEAAILALEFLEKVNIA